MRVERKPHIATWEFSNNSNLY